MVSGLEVRVGIAVRGVRAENGEVAVELCAELAAVTSPQPESADVTEWAAAGAWSGIEKYASSSAPFASTDECVCDASCSRVVSLSMRGWDS